MGEGNLALFRAEFNRSLRVESRPERLTSEAGAVVLREVLERLGLVDWLVGRLVDRRDPELITHPLSELLHTASLLFGQAGATRTMPMRFATTRCFAWRSPSAAGLPRGRRARTRKASRLRRIRPCPTASPPSRRSRAWCGC